MPTLHIHHAGAGVAAFTGRRGGVSAGRFRSANISMRTGDSPASVLANRQAVLTRMGMSGYPLLTVAQEHGPSVVEVGAADAAVPDGVLPVRADGLVTRTSGIALLVGVADCVPVALLNATASVVGVLHAGWRGIAAGVVEAGVAALRRAGGDPGATVAAIGPAVGACCYPVGPDAADPVCERYPCARARAADGRPALDLRAAVEEALRRAGVGRVLRHGGCTAHQPQHYFSVRRDGPTGCQAGVVALRPAR